MIHWTFACQECGKKFKTTTAAERAMLDGCPKCGGCDIDVDTPDLKPAVKPVDPPVGAYRYNY
jgi:predicted  nucleic acid-binding Zn-ribbon protein